MADKHTLSDMLRGETATPQIRRGQGMRLSTDAEPAGETPTPEERRNAETQDSENAETHERRNAETHTKTPKRVNRGYMLREDLIKACKRIALDEDRTLYDVMEAALEEYVARRSGQTESPPH